MSKTPRTDAESLSGQGKAGRCYVSVNFARQLETELAEAKETIRLLTTDVNYVGGIQFWQKQHHEVLVAGILATHELKQKEAQLRETRAAAFEEAAKYIDGRGHHVMILRSKANRIRKGEEK